MNSAAVAGFEAALDAHGPLVLRICRRILRDEHAGDDAAQDAFLRLWTVLLRDAGPHSPGPWLRRAAASAALDVLRRRGALHETSLTDDLEARGSAELEPCGPASEAPDACAESAEFEVRLALARGD